MPKFKHLFVFFILSCMLAVNANAGQVTISLPADEELSAMALREKAMAQGFATAVVNEAKLMLPGELGEVRTELLKKYYVSNAKPYIQGYKILTSNITEEGVFIGLDVRVNKKNLRQGLRAMGLFTTSVNPVVAVVTYPEDLDEETLAKFQGLMALTGVQQGEDVGTTFSLEPGPENTYKARLVTEEHEWVSIQKEMPAAWFNVWKRYFSQVNSAQPKLGAHKLTVGGWFSPDAALEFDRVLRGWDNAVQDVQFVEVDMQSSGVGGTWELRLLSAKRLNMLLKSYLPQRGLTYQLSEENGE